MSPHRMSRRERQELEKARQLGILRDNAEAAAAPGRGNHRLPLERNPWLFLWRRE